MAGMTSIDTSDSSPPTGLRRQDLASFFAVSAVTLCSRTGWPLSMHRVYGEPAG